MKFCPDTHGPQRMKPCYFGDPLALHLTLLAGQSFTSPVKYLDIYRVDFCKDVHVPCRMNCNHFGDPLTFHLVPSSGLS